MEKIQIYNDELSGKQLDHVVDTLKNGGVAIVPTDTLYAIVCDALNPKAIEKVCKLKGINPEKSHLSIICDGISMVSEFAKFDNSSYKLMKDNVPGPFTFLFKAASSLPRAFKGRKVVGVRIPACQSVKAIVSALGNPLLSTSIRYKDEDYGTNPELIAEEYENQVDIIVLGNDGQLTPSAIVDCTETAPSILREGPVGIS
ncbi:MAG: threonylcarbamoyl-AMP synthase [Muribaculaceae bacterium]|nr:threonylcarbamoyl-AMP synthase [Muribaculaceae bacterium]